MAKVPKVALIILSWNKKKDLVETLNSVIKSMVGRFELQVIVVDNHSTDGSVEEIKKLKIDNLKIIENEKNLGFCKGNNIGMGYAIDAGFDYIALLNDDTIIDGNLITNMVREHEKYPDAGAISPKIYFAKGFEFHKQSLAPDGSKRYKEQELGKVFWYAGGDIDWKNMYGSNHGVDQVDNGQFDQTTETDFATGCFVMYKAKTLKEVGLFDERYFTYMEDLELSQRMKKAGWKVLYSPKGLLWHKVAQSSGIGSGLNDYYLTRNRMLFGLKYASLRTKFALIRESIKLLLNGRKWQRIGVRDYYLGRFGKGSYEN